MSRVAPIGAKVGRGEDKGVLAVPDGLTNHLWVSAEKERSMLERITVLGDGGEHYLPVST
eukprot:COSAG01_NODE_12628_length_1709_cov_1.169565_3_plen_60_part_00